MIAISLNDSSEADSNEAARSSLLFITNRWEVTPVAALNVRTKCALDNPAIFAR